MKRTIMVLALLVAGCSKDVPVALMLDPPEAPEACDASGDEIAPAMQSFDPSAALTVLDVNAAWARHEIERNGIDRRNASRRRICSKFVYQITKPKTTTKKKRPARKHQSQKNQQPIV